ncbi:MAG: peptidoglycan DD-metalloendopeptidase family protein [Candidatus Wallbacteria bacterium]|nr:peptidoglycan DD-metalloendopeptidase family protein [Candidatus Wallbacteria bacterium]
MLRPVLLLAALLAVLAASGAQGRPRASAAAGRQGVKEQLDTVRIRLVNIASQYQELEKQRAENVQQAKVLEEEVTSTNVKLAKAQSTLERVREELRTAEGSYNEHVDRFAKGLVQFYRLKNRPYLAFVIGAQDMAEFSRRYKYLQYMFQQDYAQLEGLRSTRLELGRKQQELEAATVELEAGRRQKEQKSQELALTINRGQEILESLGKEKQRALERARQLQDALEYIGRKAEQVAREAPVYEPPPALDLPVPTAQRRSIRPGQIAWPVDPRGEVQIVRAYGQSKSETGSLYFNPGIDVRVDGPQTVRAVESGKVMHRGDMPNFGKVVFIDHGGLPDKIISIYGNLDEILVPVGQEVARGQAVGTVGRSGADVQDATLHFEIRQNAHHQDPLKWLRAGIK